MRTASAEIAVDRTTAVTQSRRVMVGAVGVTVSLGSSGLPDDPVVEVAVVVICEVLA